MSKHTEALKLALEALVDARVRPPHKQDSSKYEHAITAISEALAEQPAQQPKLSDYEPDGMHHNKPQKCKYPHCAYPCPDLPDCRDAEQPAQQRPQNCGTGYCSCIECLFEPAQQRLELIGHADLTIMNIHVFSEYGDTEIPEGRVPLYAGYKK